MIRVVGANPAMDRVATWPPLVMGAVNRAISVQVVPGGKGLNVARAVARLGAKVAVHGFLGGQVGESLREILRSEGLDDRHTTIGAGTRVCFIVVEPHAGRTTVLNEPGPVVTSDEVGRLLDGLRAESGPGDLLVLSGSLPDSVDPAMAGEIVRIGREAGARTVVDIHGEALRRAVAERPWLVKCNRDELLALPGMPAVRGEGDVVLAMSHLRGSGIEVAVVTLGRDGAVLADAAGVVRTLVPEVRVVNPTGSGDLFLAGLLTDLDRGRSPREALALAAACGTAGATHLLPELPPDFAPADWLDRIAVEPLEPAG